jgi:hypothetical protein
MGAHLDFGMGYFFTGGDPLNTHQFDKPIITGGIGFQYILQLNEHWQLNTGLNTHIKGDKLSVELRELTFPDEIDPFYGFVTPIGMDIPEGKVKTHHHFYTLQLPIGVRYAFGKLKNKWFAGLGVSLNYAYAFYAKNGGDSENKDYQNRSETLQNYGNQLIPGALVELGWLQRIGPSNALQYSIKYDQQLNSYYPNDSFDGSLHYNLGLSIAYLWGI